MLISFFAVHSFGPEIEKMLDDGRGHGSKSLRLFMATHKIIKIPLKKHIKNPS